MLFGHGNKYRIKNLYDLRNFQTFIEIKSKAFDLASDKQQGRIETFSNSNKFTPETLLIDYQNGSYEYEIMAGNLFCDKIQLVQKQC